MVLNLVQLFLHQVPVQAVCVTDLGQALFYFLLLVDVLQTLVLKVFDVSLHHLVLAPLSGVRSDVLVEVAVNFALDVVELKAVLAG